MKMRDFSQYRSIIVAVVLREENILVTGGVEYRETGTGLRAAIDILMLSREEGRDEDIVRRAVQAAMNPDFFLQAADGQVHLLVDITMAAGSLAEMLWSIDTVNARAVALGTERHSRYFGGIYHEPLIEAISSLIDAYQASRFQVAGGLDLAPALETELSTANIRTADDSSPLLLAAGLVCMEADRNNVDRGYDRPGATDWANAGLRGDKSGV